MQHINRKTVAILFAVILTVTVSASMILLPAANAHTPTWQVTTWAYINVAPNPVGVGQTVNVVMWLRDPMPGALLTNNVRFQNYNLTVILPDGTSTQKIFNTVTDPTSSQATTYTPAQTGTYQFIFSYPGQVYNFGGGNAYQNDTFLPSCANTTLTVQESPITGTPSYPLPTEYWTRPIEGENSAWFSIASNWLGSPAINVAAGNYQPDGIAPNSAHIMWTKPLQFGGVIGGSSSNVEGGQIFWTGMTYDQRFNSPIIMNGYLYYQEPLGVNVNGGPVDCVDLRTGQTIWSRTMPMPAFGYYQNAETPNEHGSPYEGILFTANFAQAFDARTGLPLFNVTGVPSGTSVLGPNGEILRYSLTNYGNTANPNWYLSQWNSSSLWTYANYPTIANVQAANTSTCYDFNVSTTWRNTMTGSVSVVAAYYNDVLLGTNGTALPATVPTSVIQGPYTMWAISLKQDTFGQLLWMKTYNSPVNNDTVLMRTVDPTTRVFTTYLAGSLQYYGYSLDNGTQLWGPTTPGGDNFNSYSGSVTGTSAQNTVSYSAAYGNVYTSGYGGVITCIDSVTGQIKWTYGNGGEGNSTNDGFATPWGLRPIFIAAIADGKIYAFTGEHSPNMPLYKDTFIRCINATTGQEIWTMLGWASSGSFESQAGAIADGYWAYFNNYDGQIYSIGRGPSQTTVNAPAASIEQGHSLVISGTVTDISSGTKQNEQAARFPQGVPCVSDQSQGDWMAYVYMQKPKPTNTTGVSVTLSVVDANGNYRVIGTTTSDSSGAYSYQWTPDIVGKYTVIATFTGSNSYWPSSSEASFAVDPAAATPTPAPTAAPSMADLYFIPAIAALFVAIVIVIALILLVLRKHP